MARATKKKTTLFNPGTTPVVFDDEGHIVAGGDRTEVDGVNEVAQEAVDRGLLILESPEEEAAPREDKTGESAPGKAS